MTDTSKKVSRPQIREIFLRNGARIEPDRDDLPDLVYESVFELLEVHEEELFRVRQDRGAHFGEMMRAIEQVDAMKAECEKLRKDAEFGRSVLTKREPGKAYGCHCDIDEGVEPDGCVIDSGERHYCIYAKNISVKERCEYWRVIASDADMQENNP